MKSLRDGRVQLKESYVVIKKSEVWLVGAHVSALLSASTHIKPEAVRPKKLLLHYYSMFKFLILDFKEVC